MAFKQGRPSSKTIGHRRERKIARHRQQEQHGISSKLTFSIKDVKRHDWDRISDVIYGMSDVQEVAITGYSLEVNVMLVTDLNKHAAQLRVLHDTIASAIQHRADHPTTAKESKQSKTTSMSRL